MIYAQSKKLWFGSQSCLFYANQRPTDFANPAEPSEHFLIRQQPSLSHRFNVSLHGATEKNPAQT
jgi:hypothetical protein